MQAQSRALDVIRIDTRRRASTDNTQQPGNRRAFGVAEDIVEPYGVVTRFVKAGLCRTSVLATSYDIVLVSVSTSQQSVRLAFRLVDTKFHAR